MPVGDYCPSCKRSTANGIHSCTESESAELIELRVRASALEAQVRDCMEVIKALRFACNEGAPIDLIKNMSRANELADKVWEKYSGECSFFPQESSECSKCGWDGMEETQEGYAAWSRSIHYEDGKAVCSSCRTGRST